MVDRYALNRAHALLELAAKLASRPDDALVEVLDMGKHGTVSCRVTTATIASALARAAVEELREVTR